MSVDILLNSTSQLVSLVRNSGPLQAKSKGEEEKAADPANLFSSLLEKPQGKVAKQDESEAEGSEDETEAKVEEGAKPVAVFALPQNLLSFAVPSPDLKAPNHNFATAKAPKNDENPSDPLSALIEESHPERVQEHSVELPAAQGGQKKIVIAAKHPQSADADQTARQDVSKAVGQTRPEKPTDDLASLLLKPEQGQTPQQPPSAVARADIQPSQPTVKDSAPTEIKAVMTPPQSASRVDDIQVVSERSFGTVKTLQIKLTPAELGAVTARIRVASEGIEVHLVADKTHAAEALATDRPTIEKALKAAGIADDAKITVTVTDRNAANSVHQAQASQNSGHQQASGQQPGQPQAFNMQQGFDGRNGTQAQTGFMGGEGRRNDETGQAERERADRHADQDSGNGLSGNNGRNRGLVV